MQLRVHAYLHIVHGSNPLLQTVYVSNLASQEKAEKHKKHSVISSRQQARIHPQKLHERRHSYSPNI